MLCFTKKKKPQFFGHSTYFEKTNRTNFLNNKTVYHPSPGLYTIRKILPAGSFKLSVLLCILTYPISQQSPEVLISSFQTGLAPIEHTESISGLTVEIFS
jgi:hypothetical protein